jgi:hypothetical protein
MEHRKKERKSIRKRKKREKKRGREKLQESLQIKGSQYSERRKILELQKSSFDVIFSPFIIPFEKPFPKSLRKFSYLFLDHPLAWQYT